MKRYAQVQVSSGLVVQLISVEESTLKWLQERNPGDMFIETPFFGDANNYSYKNGEIVAEPRESIPHPEVVGAPRGLEELKILKRAEIKAARTSAESAGFTWNNSVFDSDPLSQQRIAGAVQLAIISDNSFEVTWTLKDSSLRKLSKSDMLSIGLALGGFIQSQFNKGQELQKLIDIATTEAELNKITW